MRVHYNSQDDVKTVAMETNRSRSEQVIEDYKRRKIAASALRRIQQIVQGFERDRAADRRLAGVGLVMILLLLGLAAWFIFGGDRLPLS